MISVLIADDEIRICKLIKKIIDWEALGFKIIDEVYDGMAALKLIEKKKPSLVITDIRMPELDGIGLIKSVRERGIEAEFIIISGYNDFDYAKSAVAYDAFDYLLKPIDEDELQKTLLNVKKKIENQSHIKTKLELSNMQMLGQDMLAVINQTKKNASIASLNQTYGTDFKEGSFNIILALCDTPSSESRQQVQIQCQEIISRFKNKHSEGLFEQVFMERQSDNRFMVVVNTDPNQPQAVQQMAGLLQQAYREKKEKPSEFSMTFCIGEPVNDINALQKSYQSAVNVAKARVVLGKDRIIDAAQIADKIESAKNVLDVRAEKRISVLFDVFDVKGFAREMERQFEAANEQKKSNLLIFHQIGYELADLLDKSIFRKKAQLDNDAAFTKEAIIAKINNCAEIAQIQAVILDTFNKFIEAYSELRDKGGDKIIQEIKAFVAENYMNDIGLDDVAKLVCLNPSYVSGIFRKKAGENFSEYLINHRIETAKEMLIDVKYKIVDISQMVGYNDSKYFSRIFKKKVGVNPTEYRKLYI